MRTTRRSFAKLSQVIDLPDLLDIQLRSFRDFLQDDVRPDQRGDHGLHAVFKSVFPIVDSRENFCLEYVEYYVEKPKYDLKECQERGVSYSVPLKAKLNLSVKDEHSVGVVRLPIEHGQRNRREQGRDRYDNH